jgi:hypothetical protein
LQFIWQTPPLEVSSFAIVPTSWQPFADHVLGSVASSGSFSGLPQSVPAFSTAVLRTDFPCETQKVSQRENNPPSCPLTGVFLVLKLNFLA